MDKCMKLNSYFYLSTHNDNYKIYGQMYQVVVIFHAWNKVFKSSQFLTNLSTLSVICLRLAFIYHNFCNLNKSDIGRFPLITEDGLLLYSYLLQGIYLHRIQTHIHIDINTIMFNTRFDDHSPIFILQNILFYDNLVFFLLSLHLLTIWQPWHICPPPSRHQVSGGRLSWYTGAGRCWWFVDSLVSSPTADPCSVTSR